MIAPRRILPIALLGLGVVLLVAAGVCYQVTGGGPWCPWGLGAGTVFCLAAFALAFQR